MGHRPKAPVSPVVSLAESRMSASEVCREEWQRAPKRMPQVHMGGHHAIGMDGELPCGTVVKKVIPDGSKVGSFVFMSAKQEFPVVASPDGVKPITWPENFFSRRPWHLRRGIRKTGARNARVVHRAQ